MTAKWRAEDLPSLAGKVAIVTGANSGLGLETAAGLAGAGATVVMACRDPARASTALAAVRRRAPNTQVEVLPLDLADLSSVRQFAQAYAGRHTRLDVLCNNAGVMALPFAKTRDGFEMQIGTNHLGHFALTGLLWPLLATTADARIVNVASLAHRWTRGLDVDDLNFARTRYNKWDAYGKSKLANLVFTFELDRRLRASGRSQRAVAAHPGYSSTNLGFVGPALEKSRLGRLLIDLGNRTVAQTAAMGALPTLYAAAMPDVESGDYIGPGGLRQLRGHPRKVGCRRQARNPELGARLWDASEHLTGVRLPV